MCVSAQFKFNRVWHLNNNNVFHTLIDLHLVIYLILTSKGATKNALSNVIRLKYFVKLMQFFFSKFK